MRGENFLFKHGAVRLSKNKKYLEHADGTPFFFLADTWWYGATSRAPFPVFKSLVKKRARQGFSVVQIVIGIPPEIDLRSKDAGNSGGHPFNDDWSLNKEYFEEVDKKIKYLVENNIVPVIFGGWGHHIGILGLTNTKKLWYEIVARYSSYPVIFCLAGEIDLDRAAIRHSDLARIAFHIRRFWMREVPSGTSLTRMTSGSKFLKKRIKKWTEVGDYIACIDKFKRPITAHVNRRLTAVDLLGRKSWLSINSIQSGHSKDSVTFMVNSIRKGVAFKLPIINMEPWYEGILGNFGDFEQRYAFWLCILSGAKGHSYGAHGIWQMSKKGENFMKHWGDSNWQKALNFKGAKQLGLAKKFLEKYEWWKLESCFEKITPHWTKNNVYLPVAARIEGRHLFIYIPRVGEVSPSTLRLRSGLRAREIGVKDLNSRTFYKASFIDPKSMHVIDSFKFRGKESIIAIPNNIVLDLLVVISRE